jgi:hypothetical protein
VCSEGSRFIADLSCASVESSSTRFCNPREVNELLSSLSKGMNPDRDGALVGVVVTSMVMFEDSLVVRSMMYSVA